MRRLNVTQVTDCTQCGMCQLVCDNLHIVEANKRESASDKDFSIAAREPARCSACQRKRCLGVCPVSGEGKGAYNAETFHPGTVLRAFAGHATDVQLWAAAASGGFVSALIAYLLRTNSVDGAIVVGADPSDATKGKFRIVTSAEELQATASSIYSVVPLRAELAQAISNSGGKRFVFVGRPCQTKALARAMRTYPALRESITLSISVFCAWSFSKRGVDYLLSLCGVRDRGALTAIRYRDGVWPGAFTASVGKSVKALPLTNPRHFRGLYYFPITSGFIPRACRNCADVLGDSADISVGDAWNLGLEPGKHGYSLAIVRTPRGETALALPGFIGERFIIDRDCSISDIEQSQGNTVRIKRSGILAGDQTGMQKDRMVFFFGKLDRLLASILRITRGGPVARLLLAAFLRLFWIDTKKTCKQTADRRLA
jgi:coenzyme F420 hydrogenase subunit beta